MCREENDPKSSYFFWDNLQIRRARRNEYIYRVLVVGYIDILSASAFDVITTIAMGWRRRAYASDLLHSQQASIGLGTPDRH